MRHALALLLALGAAPAAAAPLPPPSGVTVVTALGGGADVHSHSSSGVGELELGLGWEAGPARPELLLVLAVAPATYAGLRPGVHVPIGDLPFYARAALDFTHAGGDWHLRWLLAGAGVEVAATSVLAGFVEIDLGLPVSGGAGAGLLGRAGVAIRF